LMPSEVITDNLLPAAAVGLFLHLLVTYGVSNKPFSLVSQSKWEYYDNLCGLGHLGDQCTCKSLTGLS